MISRGKSGTTRQKDVQLLEAGLKSVQERGLRDQSIDGCFFALSLRADIRIHHGYVFDMCGKICFI
jgi:hypothetical protein